MTNLEKTIIHFKDVLNAVSLPQILKMYQLTINIIEETPEIATMDVGEGNVGIIGICTALYTLQQNGVKNVAYDLSKLKGISAHEWINTFLYATSEFNDMSSKFTGLNVDELQVCSKEEKDANLISVSTSLETAVIEYQSMMPKSKQI